MRFRTLRQHDAGHPVPGFLFRVETIGAVRLEIPLAAGRFRPLAALDDRGEWPRELARSVLPLNTYSHMFAKSNLRNLLHFLDLRCDSHAQYEIRVYADAMRDLARHVVPVCIGAWEAA